jgi:predicted metal-dependent peptidase
MSDFTGKIQAARAQLMLDAPFFSGLLMQQKLEIAGEGEQDAPLAVSGDTVSLSREWAADATAPQLKGALAKGALSNSLGHSWRMGERDAEAWGVGCDMLCTALLREAGFPMPVATAPLQFAGVKQPGASGKVTDESAESLYTQLQQQQQQNQQQQQQQGQPPQGQQGNGAGNGQQQPQDSQSSAKSHCPQGQGQGSAQMQVKKPTGKLTAQEASAKRQQDLQGALSLAESIGNMPGALKELVASLLQPVMDWREQLRAFMAERLNCEKKWSRPNRRHIHRGTYLPGKTGHTMGDVLVILDTSGSCTQFWPAFGSELNAILDEFSDNTEFTVSVLYIDTEVRHRDDYTPDSLPVKLEIHGGGGTVLGEAFRYMETEATDIDPACCVFLTDCYNYDYHKAPDFPVLWVSTTPIRKLNERMRPPFGELVAMPESAKGGAA